MCSTYGLKNRNIGQLMNEPDWVISSVGDLSSLDSHNAIGSRDTESPVDRRAKTNWTVTARRAQLCLTHLY